MISDPPGELRVLEHEDDRRRPALRAGMQLAQRFARQRMAAHLRELCELARLEMKALGADADHVTGDAQPCERGRRFCAARHDQAAMPRNLAGGRFEHRM